MVFELLATASTLAFLTLLGYHLKRRNRESRELVATEEVLVSLEKAARITPPHGHSELQSDQTTLQLPPRMRTATDAVLHNLAVLETERDSGRAILAAMEEGVLVADDRSHVVFANIAARKMLHLDSDPSGQPLTETVTHPDLLANISLAIRESQTCSFEMRLNTPKLDEPRNNAALRHILARCAPFSDAGHGLRGAVAVLHDISELRRLERMRTEFVSNVSHELRTPLTALLGYLETLDSEDDEEPLDTPQARKFLKICRKQADNLHLIVDDLLKLSKLENPQQEIAAAELDLNEVARLTLEFCQPQAAARNITLTAQLPDSGAIIRGDRGLLAQALRNLVENAINYNIEKGSVTVRLAKLSPVTSAKQLTNLAESVDINPETDGARARALANTLVTSSANGGAHANGNGNGSGYGNGHGNGNGNGHHPSLPQFWELSVSDTGIGIPADALHHVFERFYRVDKARSRDQGGTGLGLSIVKHIALAHGASIHAVSEPGKGSTFSLRFKV